MHGSAVSDEPRSRARGGARARTASLHELRRGAGPRAARGARSPGRARSTRSPTRTVRSSSWPRTEARTSARSAGGISRARSSSSTLARIEVSGVRSSCEASATSWRWASREASSAPSIALKAAARRPGSSSATGSMRWCRSPVAVTCSAVAVRRPSGRVAARETPTPRPAATPTPPRVTREQDPAQPPERVVDLGQRLGDLQRRAVGPARREHARVHAVRRSRRAATRRACRRRPRARPPSSAAAGPDAERMTSPLGSVACTTPALSPKAVGGSWAWKISPAADGGLAGLLAGSRRPRLVRLTNTTLGRSSRSDASTPPRSSWRTTT